MAKFQFDATELNQLAVDLGAAAGRADAQVRKVVQKAALNIKKDLQQEAADSIHFPRVAHSISYETYEQDGGWVAEVGPELGHEKGHPRAQGGVAWIAYNGHATTGPTFPDPSGALEREAEAFRSYLAAAVAEDLL